MLSLRPPDRMTRLKKKPYLIALLGLLVLVALVAVGFLYSTDVSRPPLPQVADAPPPAVAEPPEAAGASEPAILHPVEVPKTEAEDPKTALTQLFGPTSVQSMFQLDGFARRFVATVDNLGRGHAPARLWPVDPVGKQFAITDPGGAVDSGAIAADNSLRYAPYVLLLESVDLAQAAATYKSLYPRFQQAYEELGYPNRYFNDRLIEVLDRLLATPEPKAPVQVHLPRVNGPIRPARPWVTYEFDDPALQALSAGQKILVRMGAVNERRVKEKLSAFRRLLVGSSAPR